MNQTFNSPITILIFILGISKINGAITFETESSNTPLAYSDHFKNTDLINNGRPTLASSTVSASHLAFPVSGINDGAYTSATSTNTFFQLNQGQLPATALYNLDITTNTQGYDIESITSLMGWTGDPDSGGNQHYTVEVKLVGSTIFNPIITVNYSPFTGMSGSPFESRVSITDDASGILASGVESIRFTFTNPGAGAPGTFVREIDVQGFPTGTTPPTEETLRIYHVGNSLTWDSKPTDIAFTLENGTYGGLTVEQGYHIACGQSLTSIITTPGNTCISPPTPYGTWDNALANYEWDAITLQAYPGSTGSVEVASTKQIIDQAISGGRNSTCKFFLYLAWPQTSEGSSFSDRVMTSFGGNNASVFLSSGFLNYWHQEIVAAYPGLDIRVIPTGIVLATLDRKLSEIQIAPYSNTYDLYRDVHHMNHSEGRHVAFATMLCAVSGIRPESQIFSPGYLRTFDPNFVDLAHDIIWHSLTAELRTKITSPPEFSMRMNPVENVLECSFVGKLYRSTNLTGWTEVTSATSPHRLDTTEEAEFFRAQDEVSGP